MQTEEPNDQLHLSVHINGLAKTCCHNQYNTANIQSQLTCVISLLFVAYNTDALNKGPDLGKESDMTNCLKLKGASITEELKTSTLTHCYHLFSFSWCEIQSLIMTRTNCQATFVQKNGPLTLNKVEIHKTEFNDLENCFYNFSLLIFYLSW